MLFDKHVGTSYAVASGPIGQEGDGGRIVCDVTNLIDVIVYITWFVCH